MSDAQVSIDLHKYTPVLGFIIRSTNVRNAFELQYPLQRLVQKVINIDTKLILSSEWDFSPLTYPMNIGILPEYVLIGAPAPESGNVLITPLAGHEIGHSVWYHHKFSDQVRSDLTVAVDDALKAMAVERERLIKDFDLGELGFSWLQQRCLWRGLRQLEEVFCDFLGTYIFGAGFIYAFEYFIAPGGGQRAPEYPSDLARVNYIRMAADKFGVEIEERVFADWHDSRYNNPADNRLAKVVDTAVAQVIPSFLEACYDFFEDIGLSRPSQPVIERVAAAFGRGEPDAKGAMISEIVTAGWREVRDSGGLASEDEVPRLAMLGDLMLKSIEMSEILDRTRADA